MEEGLLRDPDCVLWRKTNVRVASPEELGREAVLNAMSGAADTRSGAHGNE